MRITHYWFESERSFAFSASDVAQRADCAALARVLEIEEEEILLDADLFDQGIDFMKALGLRASVQKEMGYELSATLLLDYPCVLFLVGYMSIGLLQLWSVSALAEERRSAQGKPTDKPMFANLVMGDASIDHNILTCAYVCMNSGYGEPI